MTRPAVYHLLGRVSASPAYVISDEDTLEFVCALQSEHLTPEKLFHEVENNHLLLIGSNFSNWLVRLFLRMASAVGCLIRAKWAKYWLTITPEATNG